jgi:uncharacterized UBP type Zn finger protein
MAMVHNCIAGSLEPLTCLGEEDTRFFLGARVYNTSGSNYFDFKKKIFYYSWWRHSSDLASYEQQDAHEFFISILDRIHDNLVEDQQNSNNNGTHYPVLNF